jgi:hypothetical protein
MMKQVWILGAVAHRNTIVPISHQHFKVRLQFSDKQVEISKNDMWFYLTYIAGKTPGWWVFFIFYQVICGAYIQTRILSVNETNQAYTHVKKKKKTLFGSFQNMSGVVHTR